MPIQQFPPPLDLPAVADAAAITTLLSAASQAMQEKNHPLALANFRAVLQFCQSSFLRDERIKGDVEKVSWQVLNLAITARHFPMAMAMVRHLYIIADNDKKKFDAGCNWLQLLVKLRRSHQAKKLAGYLLQELLPNEDSDRHKDWINMQLADLAMQEDNGDTAIELSRSVEKKIDKLHLLDRANFWRINSFARLRSGDYKDGFHFYEYRGEMADPAFPYFPANPLHEKEKKWHGQPTDILLISMEQGLGDVMQFVRFLPAIKSLAKKIILEVQPALQTLLQQSPACQGITITPIGLIPAKNIDHWCFLNSLPFLLQEKINAPLDGEAMKKFYQPPQPYLSINQTSHGIDGTGDRAGDRAGDKTKQESDRAGDAAASPPLPSSGKKYKIGLVWATSVGGPTGIARTMGLAECLPLLTDKKIATMVDFYGLQLGMAQKEIVGDGLQSVIHDLSPRLNDFACTAAIVEQLDLVITVDTALLHLTGGLGKKTFVIIPHNHDWRWGKKTPTNWHGIKNAATSFWYPTTHAVFCQEKMDDWQTPIVTIRSCLPDFLTNHC